MRRLGEIGREIIMEDRFLVRVFDTQENEMIYNAQSTYDYFCQGKGCFESNYQEVLDNDRYIKMQCIGLKDTNGKLIYEGDIVQQIYSNKLYKISFIIDGLCLVDENMNAYINVTDYNQYKIIGNLYNDKYN